MSKTNTRNIRGIGLALIRVAHSINSRFEAFCSFSDSSLADEIIADVARRRNLQSRDREVRPEHVEPTHLQAQPLAHAA